MNTPTVPRTADYAAGVVVAFVLNQGPALLADLVGKFRIVFTPRLRGALVRAVIAAHGLTDELAQLLGQVRMDLDSPDWPFVAAFLDDYTRLHPERIPTDGKPD